jgi:flagellar biosynthesis/type III secretory pathway M-ring protein FliF/YscJ
VTHQDPHHRVADAVHEGRPVEAQYVRQGRNGRRILWVLLGGLALVSLAFAVLWLTTSPVLEDATAERPAVEAAAAAEFQGPENRIAVPAADAPTTPEGEPTSPPTGQAPNVNAPTVNTGAPPAP